MATRTAAPPPTAPARRSPPVWPLHGLAAAVVVAGIAAVFVRPLAPDLGPVPDPARWYDAAHLAAVEAYRSPRYPLMLLGLALRIAVPLLVAFTAGGRRLAERVVVAAGGDRRPVLAGTAVVVAVVAVVDLVVLPINVWLGWYHDTVWGFATQSLPAWLGDWVVRNVVTWLLVAAAAAAALWLARHAGRAWAPLAGLAGAAGAAVLVLVSPLVLEPLEHRTEPLPEGPLRAEVDRIAAAADVEVDDVVVADASRRTTRQNAYVSGLGATRRVVLYDTLVEARPPRDVGAVIAHELAHHRHRDLERGTLAAGAAVVAGAYVLQWVMRRRVATGRQRGLGDPRGAVVGLAVVVLVVNAAAPATAAISRQMEAAADLGALDITRDPDTHLRQKADLGRANLTHPAPPTWVTLLWSTHPPTASRLEMGERWPLAWRGPVPPPPLGEADEGAPGDAARP